MIGVRFEAARGKCFGRHESHYIEASNIGLASLLYQGGPVLNGDRDRIAGGNVLLYLRT